MDKHNASQIIAETQVIDEQKLSDHAKLVESVGYENASIIISLMKQYELKDIENLLKESDLYKNKLDVLQRKIQNNIGNMLNAISESLG